MTSSTTERERVIAAADSTCPRCSAHRELDQAYCLECGLALPPTAGRVPALRRRWIRRFGWYPGDWVWLTLLTLVVAAVGAAAAIVVTDHRGSGGPSVLTALSGVRLAEPTVVATVPATAKLPTAPEPTTATVTAPRKSNGRQAWPPNQSGWTIVLVSYPKTSGVAAARSTASEAAKDGLPQVGVLDSSRYPSLQPGYLVVFSGIFRTQAEANTAVPTAHQAGFGAAYSRQIAR
jgi:hypothetical protein